MNRATGPAWPRGGTPPIAKPVAARTNPASARPTSAPTASDSLAVSTRSSPLTTATTALSPARNTSDFAISATVQPTACAASAAVRVESGRVRISQSSESASRAAFTRSGPRIFGISTA